jgi:hypothetical protein
MKLLLFILLTICSLPLLATEEQPQSEYLDQAPFRKKRASYRMNTGYYPINQQNENSEQNPPHYSKTYFNYKQNDDGTITISSHSKTYGYATTSYKHSVTLSAREIAHLEALHSCYLNPESDPRYCGLIAGKTIANMYNQIKVFIPLFFEYLEQLKVEQIQP